MTELEQVLTHIDGSLSDSVERLFDLLRIKSISTDSGFNDDCLQAADWLVEELRSIGFEAKRYDTDGHPMVVGEHSSDQSERHFLFYGHYDVQPVDPLDLWNKPPFEPSLQSTDDGRVIRARGAADDKGQLMTFVEACRAWKQITGTLPANITMFFEGEEESGSPSLVPFMEKNKELLQADIAMVCDTGMWDADTPAISTRLRGMVAVELTVTGPSLDLHSGMYGGPAINPVRVLTRILSGLHDGNGRITLPGFYDGVDELRADVKAQWAELEEGNASFLSDVGLSTPAGEKGYSVLEQVWSRPSCDVNGILAGYTGEGFKTVLPSRAMAKISFRLVGNQDPNKIEQIFRHYVEQNLPPDCTAEFLSKNNSPAANMPIDGMDYSRAYSALSDEWPKPAVYAGCGGSIPVVGYIKDILGMDSLLVGFGLDDDAIHSPNEKYNLRSFHKGIRSWARILEKISAK